MQRLPIEDTIDLHTFRPAEVKLVVEEYLYQAVQSGLTQVRIIHGKGIRLQREITHAILKKYPDVLDLGDLTDRGSTTVTLRAKKR